MRKSTIVLSIGAGLLMTGTATQAWESITMQYDQIIEKYGALVAQWSATHKVPRPILFGIISAESSGVASRLGPTGDYGLTQITRPFLQDFNARYGKTYTLLDCLTPSVAIEVAAGGLAIRYQHYDDWTLAVRSYNVGYVARDDNTKGVTYATRVFNFARTYANALGVSNVTTV